MLNPQNQVYDVTIENFQGNRPARVFIRFERETPTRVARNIVEIVDAINCQPITLELNDTQYNQLEDAVTMLIWAVKNDPDPVNPELRNFLKTI